MLDVGSFPVRTCDGVSRRSFLRLAASVPLALGLPGAAAGAVGAAPARARSVLFVFLWGGPSHLDTCDPKPDAPAEYRGPFGVIPTRTPGLYFTELLPRLAQRSHRFSIVRTHQTSEGGHSQAGTVALTGFRDTPAPPQPNFGAVVARHRGGAGRLPPFVSLARGVVMDSGSRIEGYGGGTLGKAYDPFMVGCDDAGRVNLPALQLLPGLNPTRVGGRRELQARLDAVPRALDRDGIASWEETYRHAYGLLADPKARAAFDLSRESAATRARYGRTVFGQNALLARRLVEAGLPYVQLNYSRHVESVNPGYEFGWDTHNYNFELLQDQHGPTLDRAFSALLDDLYDRGLIGHTLVVCMGEFGRTPRISTRASRDHWPPCYFSLWAGGGVVPGRAVGASDRRGEQPRTEPTPPLMVGTTIAELAGIDSRARAELGVLAGGRVIEGLL